MTNFENLQRRIASGEFKTLQAKPISFKNQRLNGVTSIYDKMHKSWYKGVPISFLFQYDIGYIEWAIKNMDDFCIREYDYMVELSTFNKKTFEMKHIAHETVTNYHTLSQHFSDEEILVAFGGNQYYRKLDVKSANDQKLRELGLEHTPPKMFERTYLCSQRSSFPALSGKWEFEAYHRSAKGNMIIHLKKTPDGYSEKGLKNDKLGLIVNVGPMARFKNGQVLDSFDFDLLKAGEKVEIKTVDTPAYKYLICKI